MSFHFIIITCIFEKEGERWTALCKELGTATFADTFEEAQKRLIEAVELHLSTLEEVGECRRFFHEHKIKVHRAEPSERETTVKTPINPNVFVNCFVQKVLHHAAMG